ncbi:MAG: DUF4874 domain-containing protein [Oscillospiraceae bacterium]|jgi:hypothetical protein|nr:DUF4874 domain-containing protein [Oscillospiraceae bacterium]
MPETQARYETASFAPDGSIPFLTSANAGALLQNPCRGLRMESYITLGDPLQSYPGTAQDPFLKLDGLVEKYKNECPTVLQLYVYLSNYTQSPLDARAFAQLNAYFARCVTHRLRVLLRFAYATESTRDANDFYVSMHLRQIARWIAQNHASFCGTVFAVQAGLIGYWGEGHSCKAFDMRRAGRVFDQLIESLPQHLFVQFRTPELRDQIAQKHAARAAMHHDYIIGDYTHPWGFLMPKEQEPALLAHFAHTINDGELPWGRAAMNDDPAQLPLNNLPPEKLIPEMARYHLTTLSLEHNFREDAGKNRPYTLERWQSMPFDPARYHLPYNPNIHAAQSSAFDYIQYHLGYHLALSNAKRTENGLEFCITNFGMSAPLTCNQLSVVCGKTSFVLSDFDPNALQPMRTLRCIVPISEKQTSYAVKLCDAFGGCVRFANDTPFDGGAQKVL